MSEPTDAEIRALYATALGMLHATQRQVDSLTAQLATLTADHAGAIDRVRAVRALFDASDRQAVALTSDLKANAAMLARQCDLARDAETKLKRALAVAEDLDTYVASEMRKAIGED
jgi:hypothetical protein